MGGGHGFCKESSRTLEVEDAYRRAKGRAGGDGIGGRERADGERKLVVLPGERERVWRRLLAKIKKWRWRDIQVDNLEPSGQLRGTTS